MTTAINQFASSTFADRLPTEITAADDFISHAEQAGHWPVAVRQQPVQVVDGDNLLAAPGCQGIVGQYAGGDVKFLGMVGRIYKATTPEQWRELVRAAVAAGAKPVGSHAWDGKIIAQFDVGGNGVRSNLVLGDSFDGTIRLTGGCSSTRLACANTLHVAMRRGGANWCKIRHTASLSEKIKILQAGIAFAAAEGQKVQDLFDAASRIHMPAGEARIAFDALFPEAELTDDMSERAKRRATTTAENVREEARRAAALQCNRVGSPGNLATLWNAATHQIDRNSDGSQRGCKGGASMIESMLFGSRSKRVAEVYETIEKLVEVYTLDGGTETMTVSEACRAGAVDGAALLDEMLN